MSDPNTYHSAAAQHIVAKLRASSVIVDAGLAMRIYPDEIPETGADGKPLTQDEAYPAIVYSVQAPKESTKGMGGVTLFTHPIFYIRAICFGNSYVPIDAVAGEIENLFDGNTDTDDVINQVGCFTISSEMATEMRMPSSDKKGVYRISGALFDFVISKDGC